MIDHVGRLLLLAALLLGGGCVSSDVRDLAKSTAANVSIVNTGLEEFKGQRLALAEGRARTADRLNRNILRESQDLQLEIEVAKMAGEADWINLYNSYLTLANTITEQDRKLVAANGQIKATILKQQTDLALPTVQLSTAEAKLAALGEDPSTIDQLKFYKAYFTSVLEAYQAAKKQQTGAEKKAADAIKSKQNGLDAKAASALQQ
jgi:hypothetical protein